MEPITIDELKQKRIWVCWHYEKRKDKQTKVPITASGIHTGTDDSHSGDWMTYQDAREAAKKNGYNGVGFNTEFFVDDGFSGTNFDRPDWKRLMTLVDEDRVGTIIVKDMS